MDKNKQVALKLGWRECKQEPWMIPPGLVHDCSTHNAILYYWIGLEWSVPDYVGDIAAAWTLVPLLGHQVTITILENFAQVEVYKTRLAEPWPPDVNEEKEGENAVSEAIVDAFLAGGK